MGLVRIAFAVAIVAVIGGCGATERGEEDQVRGVVDRFSGALASEDIGTACASITLRLKHQVLTSVMGITLRCKDYRSRAPLGAARRAELIKALGMVDTPFAGLPVAGLAVDGNRATATFEDSPATMKLARRAGGWKVNGYSR